MDRFTKALSEKAKYLLVVDKFMFRKCSISKNRIKLRCAIIKSCTSNFDIWCKWNSAFNFDHNHEASVNINRQSFAISLKRATDQVKTRPLKLTRNEVR